MNTTIHIGKEIRNHLADQQRSVAWLASQLGCDASSLRKSLKNYYISTDLLHRISIILGKDFFACYSRQLAENTHAGKICLISGQKLPA